jgi:hypothetical protein
MANTDYCTLNQLRARLGAISGNTDKDSIMQTCIEAASRAIDRHCDRRFYADIENQTRYYTPAYTTALFVNDDIVSVGTLATDDDGDHVYENVWSETDYDLLPYNSDIKTWIETSNNGGYSFPRGIRKSVQIVGKFGIEEVPADVREACLLLAARYYKRKDAPFGVAGGGEMGELTALPVDVDVKLLLRPWVRLR